MGEIIASMVFCMLGIGVFVAILLSHVESVDWIDRLEQRERDREAAAQLKANHESGG